MATGITISDVTDGLIDGSGSLDKLMATISVHLQHEYDAGRIVGADYSTVYLGSMQTAMAQSIQFELNKILAGANADIAFESVAQAEIATAISLATQAEKIEIIRNEKLVSDELAKQAVLATALATINDNIASNTQNDQITIVANQSALGIEQISTQINQTDNVLANTELTRERGGFR